jgi:urate oxidase
MRKMKSKVNFEELCRAKVSKIRNIVISKTSNGAFYIAQQLNVLDEDTGKNINVFLKGALKLENIDAMYALRDSINLAIEKAEKGNESVDEDDDGWEDD